MMLPRPANVTDRVKQAVRWTLWHALPKQAMGAAAKRGDLHGRLVVEGAGSTTARMTGLFDEVRAAGPVHRGRYAYVTASQPLVKEVLTSADFRSGVDFSRGGLMGRLSDWADVEQLGPLAPPSLLVTEPPDHTRYRKLVTRVFTVRAVEQLRARAEEIAHGLLDDLDAGARGQGVSGPGGPSHLNRPEGASTGSTTGDGVDLVATYCSLLPVTLIAEILGVPASEQHRVLAFGHAAAPSLDLGLSWREFRSVEAALREFDSWLTTHLRHLREQPGQDLMSQLVRATEDGVGLDERELKSTAGLVLAAGFETTVNLLGNGIALLLEHPEQLARLRERPELWPTAVDEVLRLDPPVLLTGRTAVADTVVGGVPIARGHLVTTLLAAANRDPDVFTDPDRFDVGRDNAREHVSFSAGRHYCLGAALARMEGEVGLRVLFERYPDLELLPGARRRPTRILRGYAELPARPGRATVAADS